MVVCLSCRLPTSAGGGSGSKRPYDYDYYTATILVKYHNGNPCTTSYAIINGGSSYRANSNGVISILRKKMIMWNTSNPETQMFNCVVKRDTSQFVDVYENVIWIGDIELTKGGGPSNHANPDLVIVIPFKYD